MSGKLEIWAAGIIHGIGTVNFLFDKSFEPYISVHEIYDYFGAAQSTTSQKSKLIRDMFKMGDFGDEFATQAFQQNNPFNKIFSMMTSHYGLNTNKPSHSIK